MALLFSFLGVTKYCESSLFFIPVSSLFVVVGFDTGEGQIRWIIYELQSTLLLIFGYYIEHGGTTICFLGVGRSSWYGCVSRHTLSPFPY